VKGSNGRNRGSPPPPPPNPSGACAPPTHRRGCRLGPPTGDRPGKTAGDPTAPDDGARKIVPFPACETREMRSAGESARVLCFFVFFAFYPRGKSYFLTKVFRFTKLWFRLDPMKLRPPGVPGLDVTPPPFNGLDPYYMDYPAPPKFPAAALGLGPVQLGPRRFPCRFLGPVLRWPWHSGPAHAPPRNRKKKHRELPRPAPNPPKGAPKRRARGPDLPGS